MKYLKLFFLLSIHAFTLPSFGQVSPVKSIVELMRETPAHINGTLRLATPINLMRDTSGIIPKTLQLKAQPVGFYFDENSLNLTTRGALYFWYGGIKCKINSISYDNRTGEFGVSADTPLGLFDKSLEAKLKTAVSQMYKPKLKQAFAELKQIRKEKSVDQARGSIQTIVKVLSTEGPGIELPTVKGNVNLHFRPESNRKIMLTEDLAANVKNGDDLTISADFVFKNKRTVFQTLQFESREGIRINGNTRWPEIKSINLKELSLGPKGISINYAVGAEEVIQGLILTLNLVTSSGGRNPTSADCLTEVELRSIRQQIDQTFLTELSKLLRAHRTALIDAGVNPLLIDALD